MFFLTKEKLITCINFKLYTKNSYLIYRSSKKILKNINLRLNT